MTIEAPPLPVRLTARQREVLWAFGETGSYKITGARCGITRQTVKATLVTIRSKLDVETSVQAVLIVFGPGAIAR
jgi:DNA-binding CsgD family transcriptional regulator